MVMVKIICDSTSDLSLDLLDKYEIQVVPLSIFINGKNYLDGKELDTAQLFDLIEKTNELPKTSAPSIESFREVFGHYLEMVYISISSKLSASFQSGLLALEGSDREKKIVIDSLNLSTGIGLLAIKASELSIKGFTPSEIADQMHKDIAKVRTSFVIDTLDYLYKGGRCSAIELLVGSILKIRPIIEVRHDGTLGVKEKIGGSRKKALISLISEVHSKIPQIDPKRIFVTHCACPEDADFLLSELSEMDYFEEILITEAGSTIASHCGPKTIGILFMEK
jgi:DegV family protein with EDD domain